MADRTAQDDAAASRRLRQPRKLIVASAYLLASAAYTWPLVWHFNTYLLGKPYDNFALAWVLWWWKYALGHGLNPFFTHLVFSPFGVNLVGANLMPLLGIISIPIQAVAGFPSTYNLIAALSIFAGAFLMYLVAARMGLGRGSAFLAGFVFGFAPVIMIRATGHLNLAASFPIPLTILAMGQIQGEALHRWPRNGLLLGSAMAAAAYVDLQTAFYLLPMLLLWFLREFIRSDARSRRYLIFTGSLSVVFFVGLFLPFLTRLFPLPVAVWPGHPGADLAAFVTPSPLSPFFRSWVTNAYEHVLSGGWMEGTCYLGWTTLGLAAYGTAKCYRREPDVRWWFWTVVLYLLLACGDNVRIWGHLVSIGSVPIPLPLYFLHHFPIFSAITEPTRFVRLAMPGLALLAAFGYQKFSNEFEGRKALVAGACFGLVFLDFLTAPFPLTPGELPPIYQRIQKEQTQGGTFYLPLNSEAQTAEWAMARMDTPLPSPNVYIGTHFRLNDWIAIREYYYDPVVRALTLWQSGKSLPRFVLEGVRLQGPAFIHKYQVGRIAVLSGAATPEVLLGLRTMVGTPGEAIGPDYLFETGANGEAVPSRFNEEDAQIVARTNLLLAYETRDDLQRQFPDAATRGGCALYEWAAGGARNEPSLAPYAAIYRAEASSGDCPSLRGRN